MSRLPIRVRLTLAFTLVMAVVLAAMSFFVYVRVDNALDRAYADRADYAFGNYRYFPGRPRAVFAEIAWTAR